MPTIVSTTVEICVFRRVRGRPRYLLLKRSPGSVRYPGIWQIVTGMIETGEKAVDAALRELKEETGLRPRRFWTLPFVNAFLASGTDTVHLSPVFAAEVQPGDNPSLSAEHERFLWCSNLRAAKLLPWPGQRKSIREVHRYFVSGSEESRLSEITTIPR